MQLQVVIKVETIRTDNYTEQLCACGVPIKEAPKQPLSAIAISIQLPL